MRTPIAIGIPVGADLEYTDAVTMLKANPTMAVWGTVRRIQFLS